MKKKISETVEILIIILAIAYFAAWGIAFMP